MNKLLFLISLATLVSFSECKKGPDDPLISLHSRKARVVGNWTMSKGVSTSTYSHDDGHYSSQSSFNTTYEGGNYIEVSQDIYGAVVKDNTETGSYSLRISFKKDGTFTSEETQDGDTDNAAGTWNFTGGIGGKKNKEQIILHFTSDNYTYASFTGGPTTNSSIYKGNQVDVTFNLKELRNKKMVITSEQNSNDVFDNEQESSAFKAEYTFEQ